MQAANRRPVSNPKSGRQPYPQGPPAGNGGILPGPPGLPSGGPQETPAPGALSNDQAAGPGGPESTPAGRGRRGRNRGREGADGQGRGGLNSGSAGPQQGLHPAAAEPSAVAA